MKNYFKPISLAVITTMALTSFSGCTGSRQPDNMASKKEIEKEVTDFVYPLPTSFEVTEMLNRIGASYIISVCNPVDNYSKYITEKSQALNLGVYGADLSYASTYKQQQETMDYIAVSKRLIDELSISAAIDPDIVTKIEQSSDDKDALVKLISESFYSTYAFLQKNDRAGISAIIMAGSWVEGLFIATQISENTYENKEMVQIVINQKASLNKLFEIMAKDQSQTAVVEVMNDMKGIKAIFDKIESSNITETDYAAINAEIKVLRAKIIE